jgi:hypothetical protein
MTRKARTAAGAGAGGPGPDPVTWATTGTAAGGGKAAAAGSGRPGRRFVCGPGGFSERAVGGCMGPRFGLGGVSAAPCG